MKQHTIIGQEVLVGDIDRILEIFTSSNCEIRPHFILTGPSGSGKSHTIQVLVEKHKCGFLEVNAAQLTKEGTSGNSLSKALSSLINTQGKPTVIFVDEFDKLFISGNSNSDFSHESSNGVQNEFLKALESDQTQVFGDYGKYIQTSVKNVLFIFAGAFNGEEDIDLDRLRELGVKTEFLGRVGLVYNVTKLKLEDLFEVLETSSLLDTYLKLFSGVDKEKALFELKGYIQEHYENNTLGARMVNTIINQYFIKGGIKSPNMMKEITFQKKLSFNKDDKADLS